MGPRPPGLGSTSQMPCRDGNRLPNTSLMLTRLAGERAGRLACQVAREWTVACLSRRAA